MQALYEEAGWRLDRVNGRRHVFAKDGQRSATVAVHGGMVRVEVLRNLAGVLKESAGA